MSHIRTKEELLKLKDVLKDVKDCKCENQRISFILDHIVPKEENGKNIVGVVVNENTKNNTSYSPTLNTINISLNEFIDTTSLSALVLGRYLDYDDIDKLTEYYQLFSLLHEVEHSYELLLANNKLDFEYDEVKKRYLKLVEQIETKYPYITHPVRRIKGNIAFKRYDKESDSFIFERNANVEASSDTALLAQEMNDEEISLIFNKLNTAFRYIGYENDNNGCMYQTFDRLLLKKDYDKIQEDDMSEEDKIRFGLRIDESSRKELVKKISKNGLII